jgi:thiosulfate/3-mercaptopyruvate sulfurtransferase
MLITPQELAERLGRVAVLDASWHMPASGRNGDAEALDAHIPGAVRFDIDKVSDPASPLPHTLPSPEDFARAAGAMGIGNDTPVVVYEAGAPFAAPRVWWMFRVMGHGDVAVLDGGLAAWRAAGLPVERGETKPPAPRSYTATLRRELLADADAVARTLAAGGQVADARSPGRFEGSEAEPRAGLRGGHMPGARNVHYASLVADGRFKDAAGLRAAFADAGVDLSRPVVTTCGSGVTAAVLALALDRLGTEFALYDGSWTEWGGDPARPVATGPA